MKNKNVREWNKRFSNDKITKKNIDKRFMYEECQRMPLIIRYPKAIKAGRKDERTGDRPWDSACNRIKQKGYYSA